MIQNNRRVVIVGLGVISSVGIGVESFWNGLISGKYGGTSVTCFDIARHKTTIACEVKDIPVPDSDQQLPRMIQLGFLAFDEAFKTAGVNFNNLDETSLGLSIGIGAGSQLESEIFYRKLINNQKNSRLIRYAPMNSLADFLARRFQITGPRMTICTACSSSTAAIGAAYDQIKVGRSEMMIAGGTEALSEVTFGGFNSMRVISDDICQPFDLNRKGIILGEGAAFLVLEELEHAKHRGVRIFGEVLGYGIDNDAYHITAPEAGGVAKAINSALHNANVTVNDIDYINVHGTGTIHNDLAETKAIKNVFGEQAYRLKLSSNKSMIGHCLGAAGAIEAVATVLSINHQLIPPTINYQHPDSECDLDYVPNEAQILDIRYALSNSLAFGGNNAILVIGRMEK